MISETERFLPKINALIARALDTRGTTEEERRTSAIAACHLIVKSGLLNASTLTPRRVCVEPKEPQRQIILSRFDGSCRDCRAPFSAGAQIAWAKGRGAVCLQCHSGKRRAAA